MNFYDAIKAAINDEADDNEKYTMLSAAAPDEKSRRILSDIASEEANHRKFLQEILSDAEHHGNAIKNAQEESPEVPEV